MKFDKKCLFLSLFCIVLYGAFLGTIPLLDPDEPVYGETAKEMMATGDFLSPRIYGEFWYDKPPLFYWLKHCLSACLAFLPGPPVCPRSF